MKNRGKDRPRRSLEAKELANPKYRQRVVPGRKVPYRFPVDLCDDVDDDFDDSDLGVVEVDEASKED